jgi:hypothetical protein
MGLALVFSFESKHISETQLGQWSDVELVRLSRYSDENKTDSGPPNLRHLKLYLEPVKKTCSQPLTSYFVAETSLTE